MDSFQDRASYEHLIEAKDDLIADLRRQLREAQAVTRKPSLDVVEYRNSVRELADRFSAKSDAAGDMLEGVRYNIFDAPTIARKSLELGVLTGKAAAYRMVAENLTKFIDTHGLEKGE